MSKKVTKQYRRTKERKARQATRRITTLRAWEKKLRFREFEIKGRSTKQLERMIYYREVDRGLKANTISVSQLMAAARYGAWI